MSIFNNSRQSEHQQLVPAYSSRESERAEEWAEDDEDSKLIVLIEEELTPETKDKGIALRVYVTSLTACAWCETALKGNNEGFFCSMICERAYHRRELRSLAAASIDV